ncbi:hypothetical protein [Caballeronia sp. GAWG2-1]|uniref:hypothetical protein n=1 Tax=Caballeronia sp. GAWG2-1 TaxID=2921744 RepID=UPI0020295E45|nr:hypothetical protein [Caballeronia sp. GAWG2-1]
MKVLKIVIFGLWLIAAGAASASNSRLVFSPVAGVDAVVEMKGKDLKWKTDRHGLILQGDVSIDTEKVIHFAVDSYDFSGRKGFSVWYLDDGMGTFTIHRVFTFSRLNNGFVERFPRCGDEFLNLRIDRQKRHLISTYFAHNVPRSCVTRLVIEK